MFQVLKATPCGKSKRRRWLLAILSSHTWKVAGDAFGECLRGLKVRKPWLDQIFSGSKKIEIRGVRSPHLGRVLLVEVGSKLIRGSVEITGSHLLTAQEKQDNSAAISTLSAYSTFWAWDLREPVEFEIPLPVPPAVAKGSVVWLTKERWEAFDATRRD